MKVKQFLVTFEFGERTRWPRDDRDVSHMLAHVAVSVSSIATEGERPDVSVQALKPDAYVVGLTEAPSHG